MNQFAADSCSPDLSPSIASTEHTCSAVLLSGQSSCGVANLSAVDVFEPMGHSPIPTDVCLAGLGDDSVDKFDTIDQFSVCDADDPNGPDCSVSLEDNPCDVGDPHDWHDNSADDACALVDAGAMVACAGHRRALHSHAPRTSL